MSQVKITSFFNRVAQQHDATPVIKSTEPEQSCKENNPNKLNYDSDATDVDEPEPVAVVDNDKSQLETICEDEPSIPVLENTQPSSRAVKKARGKSRKRTKKEPKTDTSAINNSQEIKEELSKSLNYDTDATVEDELPIEAGDLSKLAVTDDSASNVKSESVNPVLEKTLSSSQPVRTTRRKLQKVTETGPNTDPVKIQPPEPDHSDASRDSASNVVLRRSTRSTRKPLKFCDSDITEKDSVPAPVTRSKRKQTETPTITPTKAHKRKVDGKKAKTAHGPKITTIFEKKVIVIDDSPPRDYVPIPVPQHSPLKLWNQTYKPESVTEFVGHSQQIESCKKWLSSWHETFNSANDSGDDDDEHEGCIDGKCLFIYGPSGVGKTSLVFSLAKDLDYKVLEYSATSQKLTPSMIQKELTESLQSHYINHQVSANSVASLFARATTNQKRQSKKKLTETNSNPSSSQESKVQLSKSLILIDDLDGIIYENRSFVELWRSLRQTITDARKPIVFTSSLAPSYLCGSESHYFHIVQLEPLDHSLLCSRVQSVLQKEKLVEDLSSGESIIMSGDARKSLNQAQFWRYGGTDTDEKQNNPPDAVTSNCDQHAALIDFLSMADVWNSSLDHLLNLSTEQDHPYNRHLYDSRFSTHFTIDQSQGIARHQSALSSTLLELDFTWEQQIESTRPLRQFVQQNYSPQATDSRSHFADYLSFFGDLTVVHPSLVHDLQTSQQTTTAMTRSKRATKSSVFAFL